MQHKEENKRIIGGYNANFIKTQHNDFSFIKQDSRVAENKSKARKTSLRAASQIMEPTKMAYTT